MQIVRLINNLETSPKKNDDKSAVAMLKKNDWHQNDYFWVTGAHDTVLDYADLFTITLRNDDVQTFLTILEVCDMEIHQKISMPDYQKLKTMVKRSINQKLRLRNFDARNERELKQEQLRREEKEIFQESQTGSSPPLQDSLPDDGEARNDFWSFFRELHLPSSR